MKRKGAVFITIILMFLVSLVLEVNQIKLHVKASNVFPVHNLNTGLNYTSIQAAINALETLDGHVIFVEKETYFEHVTIDKSLTLLGEDQEATIDGNLTGNVVWITKDHVNIRGFTIQRSGRGSSYSGISISSNTKFCDISANRIVDNEFGVYGSVRNTSIIDNTIEENNVGVAIETGGTGNVISGNHLQGNTVSIHLFHADVNYLFQNTMINNWRSATLWYSKNNRLYHNNFLNNTEKILVYPYINFLDNDIEGNYWSNHSGVDLDQDGIGDSPYTVDVTNADQYPLMGLFSSFNTSLGERMNVISNSTIEDYSYFQLNGSIRICVSNITEKQTHGFIRISIPHALMTEPYNVTVEGANPTYWNYTIYDNGTHRWIYFEYEHSTLEIIIISEPLSLILPLLMLATSLTTWVYKKKKKSLTC